MSQLARQYGLSDSGLAKVFKKHSIPRPPRGHWSRLRHGMEVRVRPLPDPAVERLAAAFLDSANLVRSGAHETLSYYAFPEQHWRRIRTNNPMERIMREIRRRTRVVGCFPDGGSALMLVSA